MKCAICKNGLTKDGHITVTLENEETTLVFRDVPAQICDNCGEEYVSDETNARLLTLAQDASHRGVSLELLKFAA